MADSVASSGLTARWIMTLVGVIVLVGSGFAGHFYARADINANTKDIASMDRRVSESVDRVARDVTELKIDMKELSKTMARQEKMLYAMTKGNHE